MLATQSATAVVSSEIVGWARQDSGEAYGLDHAAAGEWLASSWGLPSYIGDAIRPHHVRTNSPYDQMGGLLYYACRIADTLGFAAIDSKTDPGSPIQEYLDHLPSPVRDRLNIDISELQFLIASRVNALES